MSTKEKPAKRVRNYRDKSRKGCMTCRKRHLKCDETKPECGKCSQSNRKCEYLSWNVDSAWVAWDPEAAPLAETRVEAQALMVAASSSSVAYDTDSSCPSSAAASPASSRSSGSSPPTMSDVYSVFESVVASLPNDGDGPPASLGVPQAIQPLMMPDEQLCCDLFLGRIYPNSRFWFDMDHWRRYLFYGACNYPEIRDLIRSVTIMSRSFRRMCEDQIQPIADSQAMAASMQVYQHGLETFRTSLSKAQLGDGGFGDNPEMSDLIMLCGVFCVLLERWFGDDKSALRHLESTIRLLRLAEPEHQGSADQITLRSYKRVDLDASTYFHDRVPLFAPSEPRANMEATPRPRYERTVSGARAEIDDIGLQIYGFMRSTADELRYGQHATPPDPSVVAAAHMAVATLQNELQTWRDEWAEFLAGASPQPAVRVLNIIHQHLCIVLATSVEPNEQQYDAHIAGFRAIVDHAAHLWVHGGRFLAFEHITAMPLYMVAIKCRQRELRYRALVLLQEHDIQEGYWSAPILRHVAQAAISLEERLALEAGALPGGGIPECARLHRVSFEKMKEGRTTTLDVTFTYSPFGAQAGLANLTNQMTLYDL